MSADDAHALVFESSTHRASLLIRCIEASLPHYPSLRLSVELQTQRLSGSSTVWVGSDDIDTFVQQLRAMASTGRGKAEMESMSPGELRLTLSWADSAQLLLLEFSMENRLIHPADRSLPIRLSGSFEVESSALPQVVTGFEALAAQVVRA